MGVIKKAIHKLKGDPVADDIFFTTDNTKAPGEK